MARLRRISIDNPARSLARFDPSWMKDRGNFPRIGACTAYSSGAGSRERERKREKDFEKESSNRRAKNERRTWRDGWKRAKRRLRRIVESRGTADGRESLWNLNVGEEFSAVDKGKGWPNGRRAALGPARGGTGRKKEKRREERRGGGVVRRHKPSH